jgi:hypothetical protein
VAVSTHKHTHKEIKKKEKQMKIVFEKLFKKEGKGRKVKKGRREKEK